jgi:signal transduction histidine kinase
MDHTILVVDDEPASLRALQRTLGRHYRVLAANGAAAGLATLAAEPVSLIVTDQRMPGLTGVEMLARSRTSHPDVVRIVLTGYADVDALVDAINSGAVFYYLTKPWEPRDLLLAVRRGLDSLEAELGRRRLLSDLERSCAHARREAEQKTRLLATAAHELGTPVHLLGNALDLLAGFPGVGNSEWLGVAERGLAWLRRSLAQLHTGFRLRTSQVQLAPQPLDVAGQLEAVLAAVSRAMGGRRLELCHRLQRPLSVLADPRWLGQVWICLLSNAIRFTPDGGRVVVCAAPVAGGASVAFGDNGVGMTPEQLASAFEAFSAAAGDLLLHASGRFEFGARGMGLGLFIARALVELQRGRIRIESQVGRGTTVEVWLPGAASLP